MSTQEILYHVGSLLLSERMALMEAILQSVRQKPKIRKRRERRRRNGKKSAGDAKNSGSKPLTLEKT
jgi:hypothetical protein